MLLLSSIVWTPWFRNLAIISLIVLIYFCLVPHLSLQGLWHLGVAFVHACFRHFACHVFRTTFRWCMKLVLQVHRPVLVCTRRRYLLEAIWMCGAHHLMPLAFHLLCYFPNRSPRVGDLPIFRNDHFAIVNLSGWYKVVDLTGWFMINRSCWSIVVQTKLVLSRVPVRLCHVHATTNSFDWLLTDLSLEWLKRLFAQ